MPSVDELFKKPYLPGHKRKLEVNQDPARVLKAAKLSDDDDALFASRDDNEVGDVERTEPPSKVQEAAPDEEGRFFGGGVSKATTDVLDFIDTRDQSDAVETVDSAHVRKLALNFEKRISKNAEMRAKYESNPQKYMASEADLDAEIKGLSLLSENPSLYPEFVELGCAASLMSLLSHENTDIAIDAIEIIDELTDQDVEAEERHWDTLTDALMKADLLPLLYDNVARFDENNEADRAGVYHVLSVLENLSSKPPLVDSIGAETNFIQWLLGRIQMKEPKTSQNMQYSAEILTILLQSSKTNRRRLISLNGIDIFLQLLSHYRKQDPAKGTEEEEYAENLFDAITCCVDEDEGKAQFLEAEGVELCLLMVKAGNMSKDKAIRLLDHTLGGLGGRPCCERFVEAAGLKPLFGTFIRKHDPASTPHLLSLLSSLLRSLPASSPQRIRLLAKFVERDYQAISRLVSLYGNYSARLGVVDRTIAQEQKQRLHDYSHEDSEDPELREDEYFSRRMDAGLYSLQTCCVILAWIAAEDNGARRKMEALLDEQDQSMDGVKAVLMGQIRSATVEGGGEGGNEDAEASVVMEALVQAI